MRGKTYAFGKKPLKPEQLLFCQYYDGNLVESAKKAGVLVRKAKDWLCDPRVQAEIEHRVRLANIDNAELGEAIATREDRQRYWTKMMNDPNESAMTRLRASELLGKSQGDFVERRVIEGGEKPVQVNATGNVTVQVEAQELQARINALLEKDMAFLG